MSLGSLKDLYLDELSDLYAAEVQMIRALPRLVDEARAPELRTLLSKHCEESRLHLERLQLIFTHWGHRVPSSTCAGIAGIVQEADERLNQLTTDDARDAAIIGIAQRIEHYEIAVYGCARTYARRLNRTDEARLLQETLDEEGRADHRLTEIAESHINDDARSEADLAAPAGVNRFRYIDRKQLDFSRLTSEALHLRNDADEELGAFDGLVIAAGTTTPRYIVVDDRGLFKGRRYLLPVGKVRYDEAAQVLRVNLPKDIAERYPEFDRDQFETMSEEELRGYEARLTECFPRAAGGQTADQSQVEGPPEWLMTSVWITVTPGLANRLSDEARSFVNEFAPVPSAAEGPVPGAGTEPFPSASAESPEVKVAGPAQDVAGPSPSTPQPRERVGSPSAERMVATEEIPDETITPPHGDKLPTHENVGASSSERTPATEEIPDETMTPPHGDKLRPQV
jgi:ferritin-like metal-binding protein YciE